MVWTRIALGIVLPLLYLAGKMFPVTIVDSVAAVCDDFSEAPVTLDSYLRHLLEAGTFNTFWQLAPNHTADVAFVLLYDASFVLTLVVAPLLTLQGPLLPVVRAVAIAQAVVFGLDLHAISDSTLHPGDTRCPEAPTHLALGYYIVEVALLLAVFRAVAAGAGAIDAIRYVTRSKT